MQLIPAEFVGIHLTIQGLVYNHITIRDCIIEISAIVLLIAIFLYLRRIGKPTKQIVLTMVSFVFWVLAVSLPVHQRSGIDPVVGSVALLLWSGLILKIERTTTTEPRPAVENETGNGDSGKG